MLAKYFVEMEDTEDNEPRYSVVIFFLIEIEFKSNSSLFQISSILTFY